MDRREEKHRNCNDYAQMWLSRAGWKLIWGREHDSDQEERSFSYFHMDVIARYIGRNDVDAGRRRMLRLVFPPFMLRIT